MSYSDQTIKQNVVPTDTPRVAIVPSGILYRFGYMRLGNSGYCKVGELLLHSQPTIEYLGEIIAKYCQSQGIIEVFDPSDYNLR